MEKKETDGEKKKEGGYDRDAEKDQEIGEEFSILEEEFDPNYQPTQEGNHLYFL